MIFKELQKHTRLRLLKMHFEAKVGHIGGNLSALDAMTYLHNFVLQENDRFILSKGHAAGALYVALWSVGKISEAQLSSFHQEKTQLAGHPPVNAIAEIPFATGSLGHGLGLACGVALGNKLQNNSGRVFCLMSDGEWQEGSNFEALIFLNHQQLKNLTVIVDCNGLQGFGSTQDVASMNIGKLHDIFKNFNFEVQIIDGHDEKDLQKLVENSSRPQIFLMNTKKGKGVSFMENKMEWHYLPLNSELYEIAKAEVENS
jgi:transketolase